MNKHNDLNDQFYKALNHHKGGQIDAAIRIYKKLIKRWPQHLDAIHHMGMAYQSLSKFDVAEQLFINCLKIDPNFQPIYNSLASVLADIGRFSDALQYAERSIELAPKNHNAHFLKAKALSGLGRLDEAVTFYQIALVHNNKSFQSLNNLGNIYRALGDTGRALASFDQAIAIQPSFDAAYANRAALNHSLKNFHSAKQDLEQAVHLAPRNLSYWSNLSEIYGHLLQYDEALKAAKYAIKIDPNNKDANYALAKSYIDVGQPKDAEVLFKKILSQNPNDTISILGLGVALKEMNKFDDASSLFEHVERIDPNIHEADFNLACVRLLKGDLIEGFRLYEARKKQSIGFEKKHTYSGVEWSGTESLSTKTILIYSEQGFGDTIQFCRYLPLVANHGADVLFAVEPNLKELISSLGCNITYVDPSASDIHCDFYCSLMSLPHIFRTDLSSIPCQLPYLSARPDMAALWQEKLNSSEFKIGICWQGSKSKIDQGRSIPLLEFEQLSMIEGVSLISLQKGYGEEQLSSLPAGMNIEMLGSDFDSGPDAFIDTAAVISNCDLVISSDTAVAHLAGAMGKSTWIALRHVPDWRWMLDRSDSPWYPTVRLFRQPVAGDWTSVFNEIKTTLLELVHNY